MPRRDRNPDDPRALIAEAYRIEGLGVEDCRSIFFDWATGLPADADPREAAARLLARHADAPPDHPMTALLREAAEGRPMPRRRGRRRRSGGA